MKPGPSDLGRRALLASPLLLAAGGVPLAATPISRLGEAWWRQRHEGKLVELARVKPEFIWLGDSITENFERDGPEPWARFRPVWDRFTGAWRSVNLGFKGDATSHLLWRMGHGELAGIAPRAAIILIGANNLGRLHWSAEDSLAGIEAVLVELHRTLPATKPLLLSVLPSERSEWATATTQAINAGLARRYPANSPVSYLDVTALFTPGGHFDGTLFYDGLLKPAEAPLHPTAAAMTRMCDFIAPTLARLMSSTK